MSESQQARCEKRLTAILRETDSRVDHRAGAHEEQVLWSCLVLNTLQTSASSSLLLYIAKINRWEQ